MKTLAVCFIMMALLSIFSVSADFTKAMMDIFCPKERDSPKVKAAKLAYASCTLPGLFKEVKVVGPEFAGCNKGCFEKLEDDCGSSEIEKKQEHLCNDWKKEGENCQHLQCFKKCKEIAPKGDTSYHEKVVEACEKEYREKTGSGPSGRR